MKEQKTIYVVVKVNASVKDPCFHIYSKRSSNREDLLEYKAEIAKKYPTFQVALMSREKALKEKDRFWVWFNKAEEQQFEIAYKRLMKNVKPFDSTPYYSPNGGVYYSSMKNILSALWS